MIVCKQDIQCVSKFLAFLSYFPEEGLLEQF